MRHEDQRQQGRAAGTRPWPDRPHIFLHGRRLRAQVSHEPPARAAYAGMGQAVSRGQMGMHQGEEDRRLAGEREQVCESALPGGWAVER